nr:hypothetical protein [Tanacetum cinerariifolium]
FVPELWRAGFPRRERQVEDLVVHGDHLHGDDFKDAHRVQRVGLDERRDLDAHRRQRARPQQQQAHAAVKVRAPRHSGLDLL